MSIYIGGMETAEPLDVRLVITIDNDRPIALTDLAKSLSAWESQFEKYRQRSPDALDDRVGHLYVKEVRTGSTIFELVQIAGPAAVSVGAIIPFVENVKTIAGFAEYIGKAFKFFTKGKPEDKPAILTKAEDYAEVSQIVGPIANDNASQMNVNVTVNGNVTNNYNVTFPDANAIQNQVRQAIREMGVPLPSDTYSKVLLTLRQANPSPTSNSGTFGTVEDIGPGSKPIVTDDNSIKDRMMQEQHPFKTVFVVDVKAMIVEGKTAAYKVTALHECFPKPE